MKIAPYLENDDISKVFGKVSNFYDRFSLNDDNKTKKKIIKNHYFVNIPGFTTKDIKKTTSPTDRLVDIKFYR